MFELARLGISAVVVVGWQFALCAPIVIAAPVSSTDSYPAELSAEAPPNSAVTALDDPIAHPRAEHAIAGPGAETLVNDFPAVPSVDGLFHSREFELSVTEDDYKHYSRPASCVSADSLLRRLAATESVTTFLSSHDAQEIRSLCSEISVIAKGRLVHTGATREMGGDIDAFEERLIEMLTQQERLEPPGLHFRAG